MVLAAGSGGLVAFGLRGAPDWTWQLGLAGIAISIILLFVLTRSLERRLWAVFFTFMSGAAASLAAPVVNFEVVGRIGGVPGGLEGAVLRGRAGYPLAVARPTLSYGFSAPHSPGDWPCWNVGNRPRPRQMFAQEIRARR